MQKPSMNVPPEELVDGRAVLDKRLYTLADIDRIGDTIVFD